MINSYSYILISLLISMLLISVNYSFSTASQNIISNIIYLENEFMTIGFDSKDGAILYIHNNLRNISLISFIDEKEAKPWHLSIKSKNEPLLQVRSFSYNLFQKDKDKIAEMKWEVNYGIHIVSRMILPFNEPNAYFYIEVINNGAEEIVDVTYPIIFGIQKLGKTSQDDRLVYPLATGYLIYDPFTTFSAGQGFKDCFYPDGFSGTSMQFMAYYSDKEGGFYFATYDSYGTVKCFNFYKSPHNLYLICSITHKSWDIHPGNDIILDYPIVIGALNIGDWYEAAERYREWASHQSWCSKGPLWSRVKEGTVAKWLIEKVGFCTFGISACLHDVSEWINGFHNIANISVFHVLGHDWASGRAWVDPYDRPVKLNEKTVEAIKCNGDYFVLFGFDLFTDNTAAQIKPQVTFPYGCPVSDYMLHAFKRWNLWVINKTNANGRYYDIGPSNAPLYCNDIRHGHPEGYGRWIIEAYRRLLNETKQLLISLKGEYIPLGTEVIHELFIDLVDFYQMRAGAGPQTDLEGEILLPLELNYRCEKIPLFAYVYHEYGPIGLDGFAKISKEFGDIFYWIAARVTLWGDLLELNYEFSSLEMFPGMKGSSGYLRYHYQWVTDPNPLSADPKKLEFIREIAYARTDFAKDYLVYGRMVRPPEILSPVEIISLSYDHYNDIDGVSHFRKGKYMVPSLIYQSWIYRKEKIGILFVNLKENEEMKVSFRINPTNYGFPQDNVYKYVYVSRDEWQIIREDVGEVVIEITLPPRRIVLVEVTKKDEDNNGFICGQIKDTKGAGVNEVQITLNGSNGYTKIARTDSNGYFQLEKIPAGKYNMTVAKQGYASYTICYLTVKPKKVNYIDLILINTTYYYVYSITTTGKLTNVFFKDNEELCFIISMLENPHGFFNVIMRKEIVPKESSLQLFLDGHLVDAVMKDMERYISLTISFNWTMFKVAFSINFTGKTVTNNLGPIYYVLITLALLIFAISFIVIRKHRIIKIREV